jgi:proteasome alpha subunit
MGGDAETVAGYLEQHYVEGAALDGALKVAVAALGHSETEDRVIPTSDLEVAVLDRTRSQPRKFARILPVRLDGLLGERGPATSGPPEESDTDPGPAASDGNPDTPEDPTDQSSGDVDPLEDPLTGEPPIAPPSEPPPS